MLYPAPNKSACYLNEAGLHMLIQGQLIINKYVAFQFILYDPD